jgi:hypothetical protein
VKSPPVAATAAAETAGDGEGGRQPGGQQAGQQTESLPEALADVVPVAFATRRLPQWQEHEERLRPWSFQRLRGQPVVVRANGFLYRGLLAGADEEELYLRGELRWIVLPLERVTSLVRDPDAPVDDDDPDGSPL